MHFLQKNINVIKNFTEVIGIILIVVLVGNFIGNRLGENPVGATSASVAAFHTLPGED